MNVDTLIRVLSRLPRKAEVYIYDGSTSSHQKVVENDVYPRYDDVWVIQLVDA